jgi:hypothetical protein
MGRPTEALGSAAGWLCGTAMAPPEPTCSGAYAARAAAAA